MTSTEMPQESALMKLSEKERSVLKSIKQAFEKGIRSENEDRSIADNYEFHAQGARGDFMNQRPMYAAFPYNQSSYFDVNDYDFEGTELLSNKCGYSVSEEVSSHYLCLYTGTFLDSFLQTFTHKDEVSQLVGIFKEAKSVSKNLKDQLFFNAITTFDFDRYDDQMLYAVLHTMIWSEQQAIKDLR